MKLSSLITPARIRTHVETSDPAQALQRLASLVGADLGVEADEVFAALEDREKLGPTAIGKGIAMPHARLDALSEPAAALITLATPLRMRTPDHVNVDIFLAMLVPGEKGDLAQLAKVVKRLRDPGLLERLRQAATPADAFAALDAQLEDDIP